MYSSMGWHYGLFLKCKLLPEYIDFIKGDYLRRDCIYIDEVDDDDDDVDDDMEVDDEADDDEICDEDDTKHNPPHYRCLLDYWNRLNIDPNWYKYDLSSSGEFTCKLEKKVTNHRGDLWKAYEEFLKHIIVPITSEITECCIEEDDWSFRCEVYTDAQLRNIQFDLKELVAEVEHVYEDGMIVETRVRYKRPFKKSHALDVTRMYQRS